MSGATTASSSRAVHFGSRAATTGLKQEYITPYTPEQNGLIERFFRSLKEECVWQQRIVSYPHARALSKASPGKAGGIADVSRPRRLSWGPLTSGLGAT